MKKYLVLSLLLAMFITGCSVIKTLQNLPSMKFKIASATDYRIQGISLMNKKSLKDFSSIEMLKLTAGFVKGSLPLTFTLNIEGKSSNLGDEKEEQSGLSIVGFPYRLFLNDKEIVKGDIDKPINIPSGGRSLIIPLHVEFDIVKSYKEKSLEDILALLLQLGGVSGSTSNIKLKTQPSLGTPFGKIQYPDELIVVDQTFN